MTARYHVMRIVTLTNAGKLGFYAVCRKCDYATSVYHRANSPALLTAIKKHEATNG